MEPHRNSQLATRRESTYLVRGTRENITQFAAELSTTTMPSTLLASTSEIDDIFGSSSGSKNARKGAMKDAVVAQPTATSVNELSSSQSKKKRKKEKNVAVDTVTTNVSSRVAPSAAVASASSTEETPRTKTKNKKKKTLTNSEEVQGDNEGDAYTK